MRGFFNKLASLPTRLAGTTAQQANEQEPEPVERSASAPATFNEGYGQFGDSKVSEVGKAFSPSGPHVTRLTAAEMLLAYRKAERMEKRGYLVGKPRLFPKEQWSLHCNNTRGRRPRGCRSAGYNSLNIFKDFVWSMVPGGHLEFVRKPTNTEASAPDETYAIKA